MAKAIYLFVFLCLFSTVLSADTDFFYRIKDTSSAGGRQNVGGVTDIFQDSKGFIWISGENGLARYDGHRFTFFHRDVSKNSISSDMVWDIVEDKNQNIWLATGEGLSKFSLKTESFTNFRNDPDDPKSVLNNMIYCLELGPNNELYVGTAQGISVLNLDTGAFDNERFRDSASTDTSPIRDIAFESAEHLWVASFNKGLSKYDRNGNRLIHFSKKSEAQFSIPDDSARTIAIDKSGYLWLGLYGAGLIRIDLDNYQQKIYRNDSQNPFSLGSDIVWDIYVSADNQVWVSTDGGGLNLYLRTDDNFKRFKHSPSRQESIVSNQVRAVLEDTNEDIWVGNFPFGISIMNSSAQVIGNYSHLPDDDNSLTDNAVLNFTEAPDGLIWVGTENGLNAFDPVNNSFTRYLPNSGDDSGLKHSSILSVEVGDDQDLWLGTWSGGLYRMNRRTGTFTHYEPVPGKDNSLSDSYIWKVFKDKEGKIWVGTEYKGIDIYDPETDGFKHLPTIGIEEWKDNPVFVFDIFQSNNGVMWISTLNGLVRYDEEGTKLFPTNVHDGSGTYSSRLAGITEDRYGNIWVGSLDGGISIFNTSANNFSYLSIKDGLPSTNVPALIADNEGFIWATTGSGVVRINVDTMDMSLYGRAQGIAGSYFNRNAAFKSRNGEIYLGGADGFSTFDPALIVENRGSNVELTRLFLNNKVVRPFEPESVLSQALAFETEITLDYTHFMLSIEYSRLNYGDSGSISYAYKLDGFDNHWIDIGNYNVATYTNLDPGEYVFKVKSIDRNGLDLGAERALQIKVLPPPWRTWWAYTLYVLAIFLVIARTVYIQISKRKFAEEQARLLEIKVAERTEELRTKNEAIQSMLSNMQQGLFTINISGEIDPEYSEFLQRFFETSDIAGADPIKLLFSSAKLSDEEVDIVQSAIVVTLGADIINYEFNKNSFLTEYCLQFQGEGEGEGESELKEKYLELAWNPILEEHIVHKLMVTVRDRTELRKLEAEAELKKAELTIISQLLEIDSINLNSFISSAKQFIKESWGVIEKIGNDQLDAQVRTEAISQLFRNMHTIKGNARTLGLSFISDNAHKAESYYTKLREKIDMAWDAEELLRTLKAVDKSIDEYQYIFSEVLGREETKSQGILLKPDFIARFRKSAEPFDMDSFLEKAQSHDMEEVISGVVSSAASIAKQLNKPTPLITIYATTIGLKPHACELMTNIFSHLLRNSLDHGIESAEERRSKGKNERGEISIVGEVVEVHESSQLQLTIKDDGKGLDLDKLYQKGIEQLKWKTTDSVPIDSLVDLVFSSGVSTKDQVSDISGRGVGMDAVKQFIEQQGGHIYLKRNSEELLYEQGLGFVQFQTIIILPSAHFVTLPEKIVAIND